MIWPLDSDNGLLSYTKMRYVRDLKMVKRPKNADNKKIEAETEKLDDETVFEPFPVWGTSTGWFDDRCRSSRHSDIQERLGVGISIYFKQLKTLILMFFVFTVLSIPAFVIFSSAG